MRNMIDGTQDARDGVAAGSWVLGYLTAYNDLVLKVDGDVANQVDNPALFSWIDNYCQANPLANVYNASATLLNELRRQYGAR